MAMGHLKGTALAAIRITAFAVVAVCFTAPSAPALVSDDNSLVEGAKLCTRYLPRHEREYGIPVHLLAAIASAESGRYHRALGLSLPWPWTINVEGKGYFFDTKEEAMAAVHNFQARGIHSIDVGCMQVNLQHHPYAFSSLDQAFDPAYNVAYAAQFLKEKYVEEGSWRGATADYHSHSPIYGEPYARMVFDVWGRIINKVAAARAGKPFMNVASATMAHYNEGRRAAGMYGHRTRSSYFHTPHMHSISVTNADTSREKGVLVIRPRHDAEPPQQQAELDEGFVVSQAQKASSAQKQATATVAAATPAPAPAAENNSAQVVKVQDGKVVSNKGQFEPQARVIRVGDTTAAPSPSPSKNLFVFDN